MVFHYFCRQKGWRVFVGFFRKPFNIDVMNGPHYNIDFLGNPALITRVYFVSVTPVVFRIVDEVQQNCMHMRVEKFVVKVGVN